MEWNRLTDAEITEIGVDFDMTIARSSFPDFIPQEPLEGAIEALQKLDRMGYEIHIYTARHWSDVRNIQKYCDYYKIPVKKIICGKPLFRCMIDDKNIAFRGDWSTMVDEVEKFK